MRASRVLVAVLALAATQASAAEFRAGQPVMGTVLQVTVLAETADVARRLADESVREARHWDDVLTTWRPEGELARLNRAAGSGPHEISSDLAAALERMLTLSQATDGAYNPAVGPWVDSWRTPGASQARDEKVPRLSQVLRLEGRRATITAGAAIDAGGIGKGIAVDAMVRVLRRGGAQAAFIDFGGSSIYGLGAPPENADGWPVVIAGSADREVHGTMALRDMSLSTSRASGAGDAAGPIVDPATGRPATAARLAVVLSPDATTGEAWTKALIVFGRQALEKAQRSGVEGLLEDGRGTALSPGLAKKFDRGT